MRTLLFLLPALLAASVPAAASASAGAEVQVGLFYFLWHGEHGKDGPWDISKILAADPEAGKKPNGPMWGPWGANHHWGEALYGYYCADDE